MTCGYEAPTWAHYPDGRCIDGYLWDLDSGDGEYLTSGGDVPCPCCNTVEYLDYLDKRPSGNARQRRRWLRVEARSAEDGLIEAIRLEGKPYVLGLQWHPEFHPPGAPDLLNCNPILDEFLTAARGRRW